MTADDRPCTPEDATGRVLRRAEVAKMSRKLQDRLALASYKAKNGLDRMSFSMVEARFESDAQRRAETSVVSSGSSSPSHSSDSLPYTRPSQSSPTTVPMFSDAAYPDGSRTVPRKRARFQNEYLVPTPKSDRRKVSKSRHHSQSSPIHSQRPSMSGTASSPLDARFSSTFSMDGPHFSFVSSASTISDSPRFDGTASDAFGLPPVFHGSPPRTPPPSRPRGLRQRKQGQPGGEEGADLLLYLATSPSPAQAMKGPRATIAPSTPPSNPAPLPSSMINTPGGSHNLFAGFSTPGQTFNFADFCNVTPSPAQGAFGSRTPGPAKTPLAASEARRRLNFDSLLPPGNSPNLSRSGETGLGMELGGELRT